MSQGDEHQGTSSEKSDDFRGPDLSSNVAGANVSSISPILLTDRQMLSRLLYPNPVCILSVCEPIRNMMILSWITATDNAGNIFMSINQKRYTAELLSVSSYFVLNVPVSGMEECIVNIGKCSGRDVDKFVTCGVNHCYPGWTPIGADATRIKKPLAKKLRGLGDEYPHLIAVNECVAHIVCRVKRIDTEVVSDKNSHLFVFAEIVYAYVMNDYWDGTSFSGNYLLTPPILSFLGSGKFAHIVRKDFSLSK